MSVDNIDGNNGTNLNTAKPASPANRSDAGNFPGVLNSVMSSKTDLDQIFEAASRKYNVPVNLLKAVAKAESNFNPQARSAAGAQGIMQLMPATARSLGVTNPFDAEQNIMGGAKYLSQMLRKFGGNTQLALAAYNAGPGNVAKYGGIPPFKETHKYVSRVMGYYGNNLVAGVVSNGPGNASAAGQIASSTELPESSDAALLKIDDSRFMDIYQIKLQQSLLADLDSSENQDEERS